MSEMCAEMMAGQYLELAGGAPSEERMLRVYELKTAAYTVQRPIQIGMALAGADPALRDGVPAFARPAGTAFQLRDDLLGALGDPSTTGKPGDDLTRGRPTWLLARALTLAAPSVRRQIEARIGSGGGSPAAAAGLRSLIRETGAVDEAEALIARLGADALDALDRMPVTEDLRQELAAVTRALLWRAA